MANVSITSSDVYYLESIERQMTGLGEMLVEDDQFSTSLASEVLADNQSWLSDFIAKVKAMILEEEN